MWIDLYCNRMKTNIFCVYIDFRIEKKTFKQQINFKRSKI